MSVTLEIPNYKEINIKEQTKLAIDLPAGSTSLTLDNNQNIVANDFILLGGRGSELGEIRTVQSASGATLITTNATTLDHVINSSITALVGNKLRIYRAPNTNSLAPADDTFVLLTTIDIDPDELSTKYTDTTGSASYWYKFTYYNSTSLAETSLADSIAARGGGTGNYASLEVIRQEAGFANNKNIGDDLIDEHRQAAQATINGALRGVYVVPFTPVINPLITYITTLLAAGTLLKSQFGAYDVSDTNNGSDKIKEAYALLEKLRAGQLKLTNPDGSSPTTPPNDEESDRGFSGWPNGTTAGLDHDALGAGDFMFRVNDVAGFNERAY